MLEICYPETPKTYALRFELASNGVGSGHVDRGPAALFNRFQRVAVSEGLSIDGFVEWAKKEANRILEGLEPEPALVANGVKCPIITDYYLVDPEGVRRFLIVSAADANANSLRVAQDYRYRNSAKLGGVSIPLMDDRFRAFDSDNRFVLLQVSTLQERLSSGWAIKAHRFHAEVRYAGDHRALPNLKWKEGKEYLHSA